MQESYFREHEIAVDDTAETEYAKDDVGAPLDIPKRRRHEVGERKVEDPVRGGCETDTLGAVLQREDFRDEDPCAGGPGQAVESDKDVTARDNAGGVATVDLPLDVEVAINVSD